MQVTCQVCEESFEAQRSTAKTCSDRCRQRASRGSSGGADGGLAAAVRAELEAAGAVETFAGQLAITLAGRMAAPGESGISSLSKELRTVMASALEGVAPTGDEGAEPEDEVDRARRARESKTRQAAS